MNELLNTFMSTLGIIAAIVVFALCCIVLTAIVYVCIITYDYFTGADHD